MKKSAKDYERMGREFENIMLSGYSNTKRFLWFNFVRGVVYGLGIFIGGTIVVAIVLWVLGQFNDVPILGPIVEKIVNSLNY